MTNHPFTPWRAAEDLGGHVISEEVCHECGQGPEHPIHEADDD